MVKKKEKSFRDELKQEVSKLKKELRAEFKEDFFKCKKKKDDSEALFIPAGVLTGLGAGFLFGNLPAGLFLGIGAGFVVFAIIAVIKNFYK